MLEGFDFNVSYAPVSGIRYLRIIITISYAEGLIICILDISNAFQNTIITNPEEIVYLILTHLYLEYFKIKWPKHPFSSRNLKELFFKDIKYIQ